jgi:predicted nucleotidyltransferase component of viral defense system
MTNNQVWEILFRYAVKRLNATGLPKKMWSFGGGTVLMLKYNHRLSRDIDIFFRDRQLLNAISPRINDTFENKIQGYSEHTQFTKIHFPEGEIDFIVSPQITDCGPVLENICGEQIYVDSPVEIIAKKIHFRSMDFRARDVFDLAVSYSTEKEALIKNSFAFEASLEILQKRITDLVDSGLLNEGLESIKITHSGEQYRGKELALCQEFLQLSSTYCHSLESGTDTLTDIPPGEESKCLHNDVNTSCESVPTSNDAESCAKWFFHEKLDPRESAGEIERLWGERAVIIRDMLRELALNPHFYGFEPDQVKQWGEGFGLGRVRMCPGADGPIVTTVYDDF